MTTRNLAFALVLGALITSSALGQDSFPDVKDTHWAAREIANLKSKGLLTGYPDGTFKGSRPLSRYEMAVAIHASYVNLKNLTEGLQKQIDEFKGSVSSGNTGDLESVRAAINNTQNAVNGLKQWSTEITSLRKLVNEFQPELSDLRVDVKKLRADLDSLADRVGVLEKNQPTISITGDANLFLLTGTGRDGKANLDRDGRFSGSRFQTAPANVVGTSFLKDLSVFHEGAFNFASTKETGPKINATLVFSNLIGPSTNPNVTSFGSQNALSYGRAYGEGAATDVYIQNLGVEFETKLAGSPVEFRIGRIGVGLGPYLLQRQDLTSYFQNERWDNGEYAIDGAEVEFELGKVELEITGGKMSNRGSNNGTDLQGILVRGLEVNRLFSVNAEVSLGGDSELNLNYLLLDGSKSAPISGKFFNRLAVFNLDGKFEIGKASLAAGFSQNDFKENEKSRLNKDNKAYFVSGSVPVGSTELKLTYDAVEANFVAPGDWGRLGIWRNPTNIERISAGAVLPIGSRLKLAADGTYAKGKKSGGGSPLGKDSYVGTIGLQATYEASKTLSFVAGIENVEFRRLPGNSSTPKYQWINLGANVKLSDSASLNVVYEASDIKNEFYLPYLGVPRNGSNRYTGGLFTTQLSVKF